MPHAAKLTLVILFVLVGSRAMAWDYPEHREIALRTVETLDPERRQMFDELWQQARLGSDRLCVKGADTEQSTAPDCIDWAAFTAIAGDHSCSAAQALSEVLESDWILEVADVGAQLRLDLAEIAVEPLPEQEESTDNLMLDAERRLADEAARADRINTLRVSDTRLQRADPKYATRPASNNAHFLLARPTSRTDADAYAELVVQPGTTINAMGAYGWYHLRALEKAKRIAEGGLAPEQRRAYARGMLIDEAFGLHFLQDTYAAGRDGAPEFVLTTDVAPRLDDFDVCESATMPEVPVKGLRQEDVPESFQAVLLRTPVPGLGPGLGAVPRFRAEVGPFFGLVATA